LKIVDYAKRMLTSLISKPEKWLIDMFGGHSSKSGINVNEDTSMKVIAVYACIRLLSETIASMPPKFYRNIKRGKEPAKYDPLYNILHYEPNSEMTAFEFWQTMMFYALLFKNGALAEIETDRSGKIIGLWPIPPWCWDLKRDEATKELRYHIRAPNCKIYKLRQENIFHIKGFTFDGISSYDPVELFKEAVGISIAAEEYAALYFSNGTNVGGFVEVPGQLGDVAFNRLQKDLRDKYQGLGKSNRLILLEEGSKYQKITTPNNESQFLETRQHQVVEIARFFNVPPDMIMDYMRATFSNIEHASLRFVTFTMRPWAVKIEQAIHKYLLLERQKIEYFAKFNFNELLRADFKTRMEGYRAMFQTGAFSVNNILELEDMNPIAPEKGGDTHFVNGAMIPLELALEGYNYKKNGGEEDNASGDKKTIGTKNADQ
jgi:HK97 family phage portal protein